VADPFDTAALRRRVLAAWADSPSRFREDASAEEDLVRGGYRNRLVVERAQSAADAAVRAGVPGRTNTTRPCVPEWAAQGQATTRDPCRRRTALRQRLPGQLRRRLQRHPADRRLAPQDHSHSDTGVGAGTNSTVSPTSSTSGSVATNVSRLSLTNVMVPSV